MYRLLVILFCLLLFSDVNAQTTKFDTLAYGLIFNSNFKNLDNSLIDDLKHNKRLVYEPEEFTNWRVYPPLADTTIVSSNYKFSFNKHPFMPFEFKNGELNMHSLSIDNEENIGYIHLNFFFNNKLKSEKATKFLIETLSMISSSKQFFNSKSAIGANFKGNNESIFTDIILSKNIIPISKDQYRLQLIFQINDIVILEKIKLKSKSID